MTNTDTPEKAFMEARATLIANLERYECADQTKNFEEITDKLINNILSLKNKCNPLIGTHDAKESNKKITTHLNNVLMLSTNIINETNVILESSNKLIDQSKSLPSAGHKIFFTQVNDAIVNLMTKKNSDILEINSKLAETVAISPTR